MSALSDDGHSQVEHAIVGVIDDFSVGLVVRKEMVLRSDTLRLYLQIRR
jgi:hypothetical protein